MGGAPARAILKAERGAGSAAAVSRSGTALDLCMAQFGNARAGQCAGPLRHRGVADRARLVQTADGCFVVHQGQLTESWNAAAVLSPVP
jgi:hypothetical protein